MNDTKLKGLTTELQCQLYFTQLGYNVSVPLGEDCKYDMIVDFNGRLKKIQVKTCREKANGIEIATRSTLMNTKEITYVYYTPNDVDYFATFYNGDLYMIRCLEETATITLSFENKSLNDNPVKYICDYTAEKQINKILNNSEDVLMKYVIYQYDKKMNLLNTFDTIRDAARFLGDVNKNGHIGNVINNKRYTAYGFIWKRELIEVN